MDLPIHGGEMVVIGFGRDGAAVDAMHGGAVVAVDVGGDVVAGRGFAALRHSVRQLAQSDHFGFGH